jgi:hypothetical protein
MLRSTAVGLTLCDVSGQNPTRDKARLVVFSVLVGQERKIFTSSAGRRCHCQSGFRVERWVHWALLRLM